MLGRTIGVAVLAAGLLLGCGREPGDGEAHKGEATTPAATQKATPEASLEHVRLDAPADWPAQARGAWKVYTAPDTLSVLAMSALDPSDKVAARLAEAAQLLGATDVHWAEEQPIVIGPDHLAARAADGPCHFHGGDGRISYAAADMGDGNHVLLIHLAVKGVSEDAQRSAMTAVSSLMRN